MRCACKSARQNPDDGDWNQIEFDDLANHRGCLAKTPRPEGVADYGNRTPASVGIVRRFNGPTCNGSHSEAVEIVAGNEFPSDHFRLVIDGCGEAVEAA